MLIWQINLKLLYIIEKKKSKSVNTFNPKEMADIILKVFTVVLHAIYLVLIRVSRLIIHISFYSPANIFTLSGSRFKI